MSRRFSWAMLAAAGMVLGCALGSSQRTQAEPPAEVEADMGAQNEDVIEQLKEMNAHLQKIETLLYSGRLRVIDVINVDAEE